MKTKTILALAALALAGCAIPVAVVQNESTPELLERQAVIEDKLSDHLNGDDNIGYSLDLTGIAWISESRKLLVELDRINTELDRRGVPYKHYDWGQSQ